MLAPKTHDNKVIVTQRFNNNHQALCFFYTFSLKQESGVWINMIKNCYMGCVGNGFFDML